MEFHLKLVGLCLILLGLVHVIFPKQFNWKQELNSLSVVNREMVYVHTFFIALTLVMIGLLCLTSAPDLISTEIGRKVSLGFGIFFLFRLAAQFFGYSSSTWRGKTIETIVHFLFTVFWTYITLVFILIYTSGH